MLYKCIAGACCTLADAELALQLTRRQAASQKPRVALLALHVTCCCVHTRACNSMQVMLSCVRKGMQVMLSCVHKGMRQHARPVNYLCDAVCL